MAISSGSSSVDRSHERLPTFDLMCQYDDASNPQKLTVSPSAETGERTTAWLTIDVAHAVPLETVR